jgi:arylsulfatase A-like enzyme
MKSRKLPNVIIIVCDTLRRDVLSAYGGDARTPNLKRFAGESMVYDNAITPSSWTFPSHVSLFTGLNPIEHGVRDGKGIRLADLFKLNSKLGLETVAQFLGRRGYNTVGVSNNLVISKFGGFDRGFDTFRNIEINPWVQSDIVRKAMGEGVTVWEIAATLIKQGRAGDLPVYFSEFMRVRREARAVNFPVEKGARETNRILSDSKLQPPLFLFVNFYDAHDPYEGEDRKEKWDHFAGIKSISPGSAARLKEGYIDCVEALDRNIGDTIRMLKDRGLYEDSIIIITSDHGQAFNEHGFVGHGTYLHDELVRIPLMIRFPHGRKFRKRAGYQSLVNVFRMIRDVVDGGDDSKLTSDSALSEAFGYPAVPFIPASYKARNGYIESTYDRQRIAVFKDGFKLSVNQSDGKVEEFSRSGRTADLKNHRKAAEDLLKKMTAQYGKLDFDDIRREISS